MKKKAPIPFYVIIDDVNAQEFTKYDIMPYLISCYATTTKDKRPKTFDEFKEFVKAKSMYMYLSRCQYEIILKAWCSLTEERKVDVYWQIENNLELVTKLLMLNLGFNDF